MHLQRHNSDLRSRALSQAGTADCSESRPRACRQQWVHRCVLPVTPTHGPRFPHHPDITQAINSHAQTNEEFQRRQKGKITTQNPNRSTNVHDNVWELPPTVIYRSEIVPTANEIAWKKLTLTLGPPSPPLSPSLPLTLSLSCFSMQFSPG